MNYSSDKNLAVSFKIDIKLIHKYKIVFLVIQYLKFSD